MSGPWEDFTPPADVAHMVAAEAQRQGVDPALALRVAHQESAFSPGAVSPKGAVGVMQLMPDTAKDLGVDPTDLGQNIRGGVAYLKQQLDAFGDPKLALAAYNAGPAAVRKAGGVPNYKETQAYVAATAPDVSTAPPWMDFAPQAPAAPASPPSPMTPAATAAPVRPAPRPQPTIAQDAWAGFTQPFVNLGHDVMQQVRQNAAEAKAGPPKSLSDLGARALDTVTRPAQLVSDVLGLATAPIAAVERPIARAAVNYGPTPHAPGGQLSFVGGKPVISKPQALSGEAAVNAVQNMIDTSLAGARAAAPKTVAAGPKPMSLDEVKAAKNAAYQAVDASGFAFPQRDVQNLASTISQAVAQKGGPLGAKLYPDSTAMAARLEALASQPGGVPLTQLDSLRGDIYDALVAPGGKEAPLGRMMRAQIDALINNSGAPDIAAARDLNTRYLKMQEVTDRAESASLKTPQNGSIVQPTRAAMRPLVDPKSPQRIMNLTPDETMALKKVANGTAGQTVSSTVGRFLDPRSLLGSTTNMILGALTGGHAPFVTAPLGIMSTVASNRGTAKAVQDLLDLISTGGAKPAPVYPTLALGGRPALPITSPAGLIGGTALAQQPARIRAAVETSQSTKRTGQTAR